MDGVNHDIVYITWSPWTKNEVNHGTLYKAQSPWRKDGVNHETADISKYARIKRRIDSQTSREYLRLRVKRLKMQYISTINLGTDKYISNKTVKGKVKVKLSLCLTN
jgi:hypothetical protein